jgi:hypothetical protein
MIINETETKAYANPVLTEQVAKDTPLKEWLVNYTGQKFEAERARYNAETGNQFEWDGNVTVEMIVETMMSDFPEFLMAVAEENFIRGYRQALADTEAGMEMVDAERQI